MPTREREPFDPLAISTRIRKRYLVPGERVVMSTRRHWFKLAGPLALWALSLVLLIAGALSPDWGAAVQILLYLFLVASVYALWRVLEWRTEWFVATDRRLLKTYGLITQRVAMMPLAKVTDMSFDRSILGRMLGYGDFVMESAGQEQALSRMDLIPSPDGKYQAMVATMFDRGNADPTEDGEEWAEEEDGGRYGHDRGARDDHDHDDRDLDRREPRPGEGPRRPRDPHAHWEPVDPEELPEDWEWIEEDGPRGGHLRLVDEGDGDRTADDEDWDRDGDDDPTGPLPTPPRR